MEPSAIRSLVSQIEMKAATKNKFPAKDKDDDRPFSFVDGTAQVDVSGPIMKSGGGLLQLLFGGTSIDGLRSKLRAAEEDKDVERMVLNIDSPGGTAKGVASLASEIRALETETVAFASGDMLSAAYWIGSAADRVVASPISRVGSIGVYSTLQSQKKRKEAAGIETKIVRSTPKKGITDPSEQISEDAVKKVQGIVDRMHSEFAKDVAQNRNLSEKYVKTEMADASIKVGEDAEDDFTDDTMTYDALYESFEFDEDADAGREQQQINFLESRVQALHEKASNLKAQAERAEDLEAELNDLRSEREEARVEAIVTQAIEKDHKFEPAKRDWLESKLRENFEDTKDFIDNVPEGAAGPSEPVSTSGDVDESKRGVKEALEAKGLIPVHDEEEAAVQERLGSEFDGESGDYFKAYNLDKYKDLV